MVEIKYGVHPGIIVHDLDDRVVVEVSKFENKVASLFKGKVGNGFYSTYLNDKSIEAGANNSLLAISKSNLTTDEQKRDFNRRVIEGSRIHSRLAHDYESIHEIIRFDQSEGGKKVVTRYGQDEDTKNPGQRKSWAYGTVLERNVSYVAISAGENAEARFVRILPTEKFILNREEESRDQDILQERLPIGSYQKLQWKAEEGKGTKIHTEFAVKKEATQSREQAVDASIPANQPVQDQAKKTKRKVQEASV